MAPIGVQSLPFNARTDLFQRSRSGAGPLLGPEPKSALAVGMSAYGGRHDQACAGCDRRC